MYRNKTHNADIVWCVCAQAKNLNELIYQQRWVSSFCASHIICKTLFRPIYKGNNKHTNTAARMKCIQNKRFDEHVFIKPAFPVSCHLIVKQYTCWTVDCSGCRNSGEFYKINKNIVFFMQLFIELHKRRSNKRICLYALVLFYQYLIETATLNRLTVVSNQITPQIQKAYIWIWSRSIT